MNSGASVEAALNNLRGGRMTVVVTGEAECRVGHLALCASHVTPDAVNFMARHGRGVVSLVVLQGDLDRLQLRMQQREGGPEGRPAPVSIEARRGVSTGISAADRARTIQVAADPASAPEDIVSPGHIFPLLAKEDGVFALPGPAEMAADLCRLAGFTGTSVVCAVLDDDGRQAGADRLEAISTAFDLPIVTAQMLLDHRRRFDRQLECVRDAALTTETGERLRAIVYRSKPGGLEALALVRGRASRARPSPVRVQQGLLLAEHLLHEAQPGGLRSALHDMEECGHGAVVILGDAFPGKLSRLLASDAEREDISFAGWGLAARVLSELGFDNVELLDAPAQGGSAFGQFGLDAMAAPPAPELLAR